MKIKQLLPISACIVLGACNAGSNSQSGTNNAAVNVVDTDAKQQLKSEFNKPTKWYFTNNTGEQLENVSVSLYQSIDSAGYSDKGFIEQFYSGEKVELNTQAYSFHRRSDALQPYVAILFNIKGDTTIYSTAPEKYDYITHFQIRKASKGGYELCVIDGKQCVKANPAGTTDNVVTD